MKKLIFKIIVPFTIISFATFSKWWYALPVDAPDTMFTGFPLAYTCQGWHTSMSLQIFITELIIDILIYFLFWFIIIFFVDQYLKKIKTNTIVTICLWTISGFFITFGLLFASNSDNIFYIKRPFEIKILETGYEFIWQHTERPDYYDYFPEEKK